MQFNSPSDRPAARRPQSPLMYARVRSAELSATGRARLAGEGRLVSAWPLHFAADSERPPLIYLLQTDSVAGLQVAQWEAEGQGILLNKAETAASRWPKGVAPDVALWLNADPARTPYDPASAAEVQAILEQALDSGEPCYLSLHDEIVQGEALPEPEAAYRGMYCLKAGGVIRLCAAGRALARVQRAAALLRADWEIESEIWSCPSYTRLAREGRAVDNWNALHPLSAPRQSHAARCLGANTAPVLAVTDYAPEIAGQLAAQLRAPFAALGSQPQAPQLAAIMAAALQLLAADGLAPAGSAQEALLRYA